MNTYFEPKLWIQVIMHSAFGKMVIGFIYAVTWMCKHGCWEMFIQKHAYASSCVHVSKSDLVCVQGLFFLC